MNIKKLKKKKSELGYNLFTISSYNSLLENFHSDIIASLLDTNGLHNENDKFLKLFLSYIKKYFYDFIVINEFQNVIVNRELGRIDIWLRDEKSKKSIIIENKINNAPDMDNQLTRYYDYSTEKYDVIGIIYLSLNGMKMAPHSENEEVNKIVKNIAAFSNTSNDLINGWLKNCFEHSTNEDSRSFLHQYIKLITHLSNNSMDNQIKDDFYHFINANNAVELVKTVKELYEKMPEYRADKLILNIKNIIIPFNKQEKYRPNHWIFSDYIEKDSMNSFIIGVWFNIDYSAHIVFLCQDKQGNKNTELAKNKLTSIGVTDFIIDNYLQKIFKLIDFNNNLEALDTKVFETIKYIFEGLSKQPRSIEDRL